MPFEYPSLDVILYRAWRLRRLIAFAAAIPFVIFAFLGLVGLNGLAGSTTGLIALTLVHLALIAGHAIVFPNAQEETLAIAFLLSAFGIVMAIIPSAVLGLLICLGLGIWGMMWGQAKIPFWQSATKPHHPVLKGRIRVRAEPEAVRAWYPLRPDSERGHFRCGPVGKDGAFPVWYGMPLPDIFSDVEKPEVPEFESNEEFLEAIGLDEDDPAYEINKMLREEGLVDAPSAFDPEQPNFWARIETDEPDLQVTRLMEAKPGGGYETQSVVEHRFKRKRNSVIVTETDTPESYPWGMSFMMWLNDFHMDGLIYLRQLIEQTPVTALRGAHRWSLLTLAGRWFMVRQMGRADAA
ncbi:MAG: hypothetical protein LJE62_13245 [Silicimonas sp.]|nr:hypothetical protein [Silicimonas sp.]